MDIFFLFSWFFGFVFLFLFVFFFFMKNIYIYIGKEYHTWLDTEWKKKNDFIYYEIDILCKYVIKKDEFCF